MSVPPETRSNPRSFSAAASALAFATICLPYSLNDGCAASLSATAIAAVVWLCGPPCNPGKTALSRTVACSALETNIAPRGPRKVLCVVVVITSANGTGEGWTPAAINPAMCAASAAKTAPTSFATEANASKSMRRGTAVPPAQMSFGRSWRAMSRISS